MTLQTIEQVLPLLELIQQPAFCIANYGSVFCNPPARLLAPVSAQDLPYWLDSGMEVYEQWDRSSNLLLPVSIGTQILNATIQPLADGTLFLLSPCATFASGSGELGVTAQVLRQPLNDLFSMAQQISETLEEAEDPLLLQQIYRPADREAMRQTLALLDALCAEVKLYRLGCNMDPEAAEIAYHAMEEGKS